ncbi:hypothetical protein BJ138DRAFT_1120929 [Hygrophoropsis aurantiaca]|uniref:Uncharacterized protein n=1 Tax=Hygrophoropsis aurantiaca TaxID=72124 RepID=A0ACB7ZPC5_9AGAM|nr:hypothetical protein BJ138DRAFT_1120929 [Hygrophoropsis aurantiaca]
MSNVLDSSPRRTQDTLSARIPDLEPHIPYAGTSLLQSSPPRFTEPSQLTLQPQIPSPHPTAEPPLIPPPLIAGQAPLTLPPPITEPASSNARAVSAPRIPEALSPSGPLTDPSAEASLPNGPPTDSSALPGPPVASSSLNISSRGRVVKPSNCQEEANKIGENNRAAKRPQPKCRRVEASAGDAEEALKK